MHLSAGRSAGTHTRCRRCFNLRVPTNWGIDDTFPMSRPCPCPPRFSLLPLCFPNDPLHVAISASLTFLPEPPTVVTKPRHGDVLNSSSQPDLSLMVTIRTSVSPYRRIPSLSSSPPLASKPTTNSYQTFSIDRAIPSGRHLYCSLWDDRANRQPS